MIFSSDSLVKYNNPVAVSTKNAESDADKKKENGHSSKSKGASHSFDSVLTSAQHLVDTKSTNQTEDLLNLILPPREWIEKDQRWVQKVSSTPATRSDVSNMQADLDNKLQQRQAKETGICAVRRQLYSQCFDELIRQVTINCSERGLMLLRVRNEMLMSMAAHQALYESSIAFGIRKALQAEEGKSQKLELIERLKEEKKELEKEIEEMKARQEQAERRTLEQQALEEKKTSEEIQFLKKTSQQLKTQLMSVIKPQHESRNS